MIGTPRARGRLGITDKDAEEVKIFCSTLEPEVNSHKKETAIFVMPADLGNKNREKRIKESR